MRELMISNEKIRKKPVSLIEALTETIDVGALLEGISFNEYDVVEAALSQPKLYKDACVLRVQYMHRRSKLEAKLEVMRGEYSQRYRNIRNEAGKREHTEGAVKAFVETRPRVMRLREKIDRIYALEELAKHLIDVFRQRKDAIRIIVDAGKIGVQLKELAMIKGSAKLRNALFKLRNRWQEQNEEEE
jgi:hypothetical protein